MPGQARGLHVQRTSLNEDTLMSDNTQQRGGQDRERINVHQDHELRRWAKKFDATPEQLKEAVQAVGDRADAVEMHLKGSRASTNADRAGRSGGSGSGDGGGGKSR